MGDIAFFKKYYLEQNETQREVIRRLHKEGQLEIVHGGMVSNDEACPNYTDILRNFEAGHDWLLEEFGVVPTIGMQLDPFGHSSANAQIFAEMGLETMLFARMNE